METETQPTAQEYVTWLHLFVGIDNNNASDAFEDLGRKYKITSAKDLVMKCSEADLMQVRCIGKKTVEIIKGNLEKTGLSLRKYIPEGIIKKIDPAEKVKYLELETLTISYLENKGFNYQNASVHELIQVLESPASLMNQGKRGLGRVSISSIRDKLKQSFGDYITEEVA